jgi:dihydrofolate synthase/folylpolyglutamate synthase
MFAMNYDEALSFIHSVTWIGSKLGLDRVIELCERLGNPEKKLKVIHIAGTNGKGKTYEFYTLYIIYVVFHK